MIEKKSYIRLLKRISKFKAGKHYQNPKQLVYGFLEAEYKIGVCQNKKRYFAMHDIARYLVRKQDSIPAEPFI